MAGSLHLRSGAPSIGLTKNNPFTSLHGHRIRKASPAIDAPPRGSSSDEEVDGQAFPHDGASDDSMFGRSEKKENTDRTRILRTGTDSSPARGEYGKKRELSLEPSNIRAGSFTSAKGHGSHDGSQSSQKRRNVAVDVDEESIAFSQPKKQPKRSYGSKNIEKGPVTKPGNPKKVPPKENEKPGSTFKDPISQAVLAQGRRSLHISFLGMHTNTADVE